MLTSSQYEAIGHLTIAFNGIEYVLDIWSSSLIGIEEPMVSQFLATGVSDQKFFRKLEFFKGLIAAIVTDYHSIGHLADPIEGYLADAKKLSEDRNRIVHAFVVVDSKATKLYSRGKQQPPSVLLPR
jgi:hypothetical protein